MRNTRWSSRARGGILGLAAGVLLLAAGLVWRQLPLLETRATLPQRIASKRPPAGETSATLAVKPPPMPTDGFVGSDACAQCHASIAETYRLHPMYHSAGRVPGEYEVEDFERQTAFRRSGGRDYQVERKENMVVHHELMFDASGKVIDDLAVPIHLFIGSGTRGKTYAVNRGGLLFESLISWFSTDGGHWDLSPGYEHLSQRNFQRRIRDACIVCHAGRVANVPGEVDTFAEPLFLEAAIGCERCHGPGAKHVALREADEVAVGRDDSIVNPKRLDPERRESICNQCHLQGEQFVLRYGKTFYDFRPGQLLDEVWTVSVEGSGVRADGSTKAVSQVQQMRASACFRQSAGQMNCNSCHPAHSEPDHLTKADYYRNRCLECHAVQGCSLPEAERAEPPAENSCILCHMPRLSAHDIPHASQTDHRVRRSPKDQPPDDPNRPMISDWEIFGHAEQRLARWEVDRVRGLNRVQMAMRYRQAAEVHAREAEPLLRSSLNVAPDDVPVLEALGLALMAQQRDGEARECLERLLEIQPRHERSLELLTEICHGSGDFARGIEYGDRLLAVNPWLSRNYTRQAAMLRGAGRIEQALQCAEEALRIDPWETQVRGWLVEAYRAVGHSAEEEHHAEFLRRMRGG